MGWVGNQRKYSEAEDELSFIKPSEILARTTVPPSLSGYRCGGAASVVTHEQMFSVEVRLRSIAHADWTGFLPLQYSVGRPRCAACATTDMRIQHVADALFDRLRWRLA